MNEEKDSIKATLEEIRTSLYPDIPSSVLEEIIDIQVTCQDDPEEAMRQTRGVVDKFIETNPLTPTSHAEI